MFPPSLFVCFLFLSKSHSLFFLFSSGTYFPLLSFRSSSTLPIVYWYCARVALRASFARARVSMRMSVHVIENGRDITKADRQGQQNFDAAGPQHQGRLRVHPALTTTTELSRGWWTFVSDKRRQIWVLTTARDWLYLGTDTISKISVCQKRRRTHCPSLPVQWRRLPISSLQN